VEPDGLIHRFTSSLGFDRRLVGEDIAGSRAYARALADAGVLMADEQSRIDQALQEIASEFPPPLAGEGQGGGVNLPPPLAGEGRGGGSDPEDIHMLIEQRLRQKLGPLGGKLHTGRSRNDQVALDTRLYVKSAGKELLQAVTNLASVLISRAREHVDTVMPGYTHTQRAQPVLLAHHLLAYVEMLGRDRGRIQDALKRANVSPLGAGALAGSGFPIDRMALATSLGLESAAANSIDAVSDRDFVVELIAACSITMLHLSRLCGEIILWNSAEFSFATLPDALASGSSMMPNKKNPCAAELVRAKSGRVAGDLVNLLMVLKGLPLAYNRDLQEDKEALFDAVDTTLSSLQVTARLVEGLRFDVDSMRTAAIGGYTLATELADYLTRKGMAFRDAHRLVGQIVSASISAGRSLDSYAPTELRSFSPLFDADVVQHLTIEGALKSRDVYGGTAPGRVREALANVQA
jgi:argininosuccinate lyase